MIAETIPRTSPATNGLARKRKIPAALVKETIDGIPFYYAGFRSERKKATEFIGLTGGIKWSSFIKSSLFEVLIKEWFRNKGSNYQLAPEGLNVGRNTKGKSF